MTLKVVLERCLKVVFDQYINITVVLFSGNKIKIDLIDQKKISLLIFFAAYLITNIFSIKL